jgi:hypothetical protein
MGCTSSKQRELFLDQNGQEISVPKRPTWNERRPDRKIREHRKKSAGPPSPIVHEPAPWVKGHAMLIEEKGQLVVCERKEEIQYVLLFPLLVLRTRVLNSSGYTDSLNL